MIGSDDQSEAPRLPADAQARIGARLRQMYDSVVQEEVPDRFKALLDQLQAGTPTSNRAEAPQSDTDASS